MTKPNFEPVPIAIVDFAGDGVGGGRWRLVIRNDLQSSGLFRSIAPGSFIERNINANAAPRFQDWRSVGATGLVVGQVSQCRRQPQGRLPPVGRRRGAAGCRPAFTSQPNNWRRVAHKIADAIYKR